TVHRNILNCQPLDGLPIVIPGGARYVNGISGWVAAPAESSPNEMIPRRHLLGGAECLPGVETASFLEFIANSTERSLIPFGNLKLPRPSWLFDLDCILKRANLLKVGRIVGVDESPDEQSHIARSDLFPGDCVWSGVVDCRRIVVVFADQQQRHEPPRCIRKRNRYRSCVEVEDATRIMRIPVHTHDRLLLDISKFSAVNEPAECSVLHEAGEICVRLSPYKVVLRYDRRFGFRVRVRCLVLALTSRKSGRENDHLDGLHNVSLFPIY